MKALVTGGAGFAGSHLTEFLLGRGWEVTVLAAEHEGLGNIEGVLDRVRVHAEALQESLGYRFLITFEYLDEIPRKANFKYEDFVSEIQS